MFTRRIFFGVLLTIFGWEGSRVIYRTWAQQNKGAGGWRGALAGDVEQVTG